ncbi:DUF418 domain-containing protein [Planococcus salinus]|uniref:DUF418 domain-containing protein n=1 Tax=Planococcus salinus TaxID=1848460 RepID=A0A3M8P4K3_9BACL|nr:DUF418 domain-containing protein [Planococcus salinus]RNF38144.1 DUF418 domain-containing protein [Planococcus salinus]
MKLQPVALNERIEAIDLMRGFALLGILLVNMLTFHSPYAYVDPYTWFSGSPNAEVFSFIDIFVQASFYPLFSILFGYGLGMQYLRAQQKNAAFAPLAVRRLAVLLVIGMIHAFLIWYGDILITYAVTGFLLLTMIRIPSAWLLGLAAIIYTVPHTLMLLLLFVAVAVDPNFYTGMQEVQSSLAAYPTGTFAEIFSQRLDDWLYHNNFLNFLVMILTILPFLMVGAAAAKWQLIERTARYKKLWIGLATIPLAAGLALKLTPFLFDANYAFVYVQNIFGGPLLAAGYAAIIALVAQHSGISKLLKPLSKAGRMSLTIYITQSIIATTIFYSYGLGLYGQVSVLSGTVIALGIFAVQLIFAEIWFLKFDQGPLEKIWRKLSYQVNFKKSPNSKP